MQLLPGVKHFVTWVSKSVSSIKITIIIEIIKYIRDQIQPNCYHLESHNVSDFIHQYPSNCDVSVKSLYVLNIWAVSEYTCVFLFTLYYKHIIVI